MYNVITTKTKTQAQKGVIAHGDYTLFTTTYSIPKQILFLLNFICKYIPLKQWAFDDSHSPKYQMFKVDQLPKIIFYQQDWGWTDLISYYKERYNKTIKPVFRHNECDIPETCHCPLCNAPVHYLMWNDGKKKSQLLCKVCQSHFSPTKDNRFSKNTVLKCPHCSHNLEHKKDRKHLLFINVLIISVLTTFSILRK